MMPESKEELKVKCQVMLLSVIVLFCRSLTSRADNPRVWWRVWWQKRPNLLERTVIGKTINVNPYTIAEEETRERVYQAGRKPNLRMTEHKYDECMRSYAFS